MSDTLAASMAETLIQQGYDYLASVPCSILSPLLKELDRLAQGRDIPNIAAPREDTALGLCCGAYLAGRKPLALMQNSGLGLSVNAIASLIQPFAIPLLMVISVRGYRGLDSEENLMMGTITERLLADLGVPTFTAEADDIAKAIAAASASAQKECTALLVTTETFLLGPV